MTESNKINVIYEDLTPDTISSSFGNGSVQAGNYDRNHWWAEVRCLEGKFFPSGKFLHAVRDTKMTFGQASSKCNQLGMNLILPETATENSIVNEYLSGNGFYLRKSLAVVLTTPTILCGIRDERKYSTSESGSEVQHV